MLHASRCLSRPKQDNSIMHVRRRRCRQEDDQLLRTTSGCSLRSACRSGKAPHTHIATGHVDIGDLEAHCASVML